MSQTMLDTIYQTGLVPVVKIEDAQSAPGLAKALQSGGIPIAEITFRTSTAGESIARIRSEVPEVLAGAGTVINLELAKQAVAAGAQFIVSPGLNPAVVEYCLEQQIPIIPGVNDPSAIEAALGYGLQTLKFFPAEASGGAAMVKALAGPFGQVKFVPTGGIHAGNLSDYAVLPNVLAVGGSWMVPGNAVQNQDWDTIRKLCITAVQLLHGFSFAHVGINARDEQDGAGIAGFFNQLGIPSKEGASSYFASDAIEIMKQPYRGRNGHIAIRTHSIDRALPFLAQLGYSAIDDSAKYVNGKLKAIYLQPELGGFALHLLQ